MNVGGQEVIPMKTGELPEEILEKLQQVEGKDFAEKIVNLLKQRISAQLRECDELAGKHSHEVERDLMEWEGLVLERQK